MFDPYRVQHSRPHRHQVPAGDAQGHCCLGPEGQEGGETRLCAVEWHGEDHRGARQGAAHWTSGELAVSCVLYDGVRVCPSLHMHHTILPLCHLTYQPLYQSSLLIYISNTSQTRDLGDAEGWDPHAPMERVPVERDMDYEDETKIVLRYSGHFVEDRIWDQEPKIGAPVIEGQIVRPLSINYYCHDGTISMFEKKLVNTGVGGGTFLKKCALHKDTPAEEGRGPPEEGAHLVTVYDLIPGNVLNVLGLQIHITQADTFSRRFLKEKMDFTIPLDLEGPEVSDM